jgi:hypothetical protein
MQHEDYPIIFITTDNRKFTYDGKRVKELKKEITGGVIKLARPMLVYDVEELDLADIIENYGNLLLGEILVRKFISEINFKNFILYVDHLNKEISVYVEGGKTFILPYSTLPFLRYLLAKLHSGILLESVSVEELELLSP